MKQSNSEFLVVRGRRLHVRVWGDAAAPLLLLLHGWSDVSASWQFVVDELRRDWRVLALDWPGCGLSEWSHQTYYFQDYLADLDALLDHYSPNAAIPVVGHSMGGNLLCIYAGIFPSRISHVVCLEAFGNRRTSVDEAPDLYGELLLMMKKEQSFRTYPDRDALAARLRRDNPRLTAARASFLANHIGIDNDLGSIDFAVDPAHRVRNPSIQCRIDESMACWRRITAPIMLVRGCDSEAVSYYFPQGSDEHRLRVAAYPNLKEVFLQDCGHNMHHDQPAAVARLIEEFISTHPSAATR